MASNFTGAIIGHSFARSLQDHIQPKYEKLKLSHADLTLPHYTAQYLEVDKFVNNIHIEGESGAMAHSYVLPVDFLKSVKPDIVVFEMGSNDINQGYDPISTAEQIIVLAEALRDLYNVKSVHICSVINSASQKSLISPAQFAARAEMTNLHMKSRLKARLNYHVHPGFWRQTDSVTPLPVSSWSRDGTHPNDHDGRRKHLKSIKTAFHNGAREAKKY